MKNPLLILACCGLVYFASCTKTDPDPPGNNNNNNPPTQKELLEAGKWQLYDAKATLKISGNDTTYSVYADFDTCDYDDFILFATDGTGTIDESTNKCADDAQIENFTWQLLNNDSTLIIKETSKTDTFDVLELSATNMTLKAEYESSPGNPYFLTFFYKNIK